MVPVDNIGQVFIEMMMIFKDTSAPEPSKQNDPAKSQSELVILASQLLGAPHDLRRAHAKGPRTGSSHCPESSSWEFPGGPVAKTP